jgi:hypothetical protein
MGGVVTHHPKARYREVHPELFDADAFESWRAEWGGMPEYEHELATPYKSITLHFRSEGDVLECARRLGFSLTKGRSLWFPPEQGK